MPTMNDTFFWDGDRWYGELELFCAWRTFFKPGVRVKDDGTLDYACTVTGNNITTVGGLAYVNGCFRYDAQARSLPVTIVGDCSLVIRANYANKTCDLQIIEGHYPTRNDTIYDLLLYRLRGTGSSVTIVEDCRANSDLCGVCQARATTDLDAKLQELLDRYQLSLDNLGGQNRRIYLQASTPTPQANGEIWFDTNRNVIYYSHNGQWIALVSSGSNLNNLRYYGVCVGSTDSGSVQKGETLKIPFRVSMNDVSSIQMPKCYVSTDFAELQSTGEALIKKSGFYSITMCVHISDAGQNNEFQIGLFKNQGTNSNSTGGGKMLLSEVYTRRNAVNHGSGSCHATVYLQKGDKISGYIYARQVLYQTDGLSYTAMYENLNYRLHGFYTYMTIVPVTFDSQALSDGTV